MAASGFYTVVGEAQTIATAITALEITATAAQMMRVYRAWMTQTGLTASARIRVQVLRKTATITGTASPPTARPEQVSGAAFDGTVKWVATAEGTDGVVLDAQAVDVLNGYEYGGEHLKQTRAGLWVPPSGIIAIKFPAAPSSASWTFGFALEVVG